MTLDTRSHRNKVICCLERGGPMSIDDLDTAYRRRVYPAFTIEEFAAFLAAMATPCQGQEPEIVIEDVFVRLPWQP